MFEIKPGASVKLHRVFLSDCQINIDLFFVVLYQNHWSANPQGLSIFHKTVKQPIDPDRSHQKIAVYCICSYLLKGLCSTLPRINHRASDDFHLIDVRSPGAFAAKTETSVDICPNRNQSTFDKVIAETVS